MDRKNDAPTVAMRQMSACSSGLQDVQKMIWSMLNDVVNASHSWSKPDILMSWFQGHRKALEHLRFALELLEEGVDFMETEDFWDLDGDKKVDYWESLKRLNNHLKNWVHSFHFMVFFQA